MASITETQTPKFGGLTTDVKVSALKNTASKDMAIIFNTDKFNQTDKGLTADRAKEYQTIKASMPQQQNKGLFGRLTDSLVNRKLEKAANSQKA